MSKHTSQLLGISKLREIINVLRHYNFPEARWFDLGLQLGLLFPKLTAIETAHRIDAARCLMECLTKWLSNGDATWQGLVSALKGMGENAIAENTHKTSELVYIRSLF